jgi:hypothetical protein
MAVFVAVRWWLERGALFDRMGRVEAGCYPQWLALLGTTTVTRKNDSG